MKKRIIIVSIMIVCIMLGLLLNQDKPYQLPENNVPTSYATRSSIVVQIKGEVKYPGIYEMEEENRIYQLVAIAGGFTVYAESDALNLVEKLRDGMVVVVAKKTNGSTQIADQNRDKISINQANVNDLMKLSGIGEARAKSIVEYRDTNGPFRQLTDLLKISGISDNIFNNIIDDICL